MAFPPQFLQQVRERMPVSRVVSRKVRLQRRGREFVGLSPFQTERTPSFTVNDDKQFYHCFSSGRHGDVFRFLMETEGLSFPEAVRQLANEAGLELPREHGEYERRVAEEKPLQALVEAAAGWFQQQLQSAEGKAARDLLAARRVSPAACQAFGLGYAPRARQALPAYLRGQGAKDSQLEAAGLATRYEGKEGLQGRLAERLIFPIHDAQGRAIGFGGRALAADAKAKYLNSPETPLFRKRESLYNVHRARAHAFKHKTLFVVEGYMDVIALADVGCQHAAAPLGTAISEQQIQLAWRLADEPILCLDGDAAGRQAAARAVERALPLLQPGKSLRFVRLPEGQDPDELVRREGLAALQALAETALPLVDMLWQQVLDATPHETPEGQAQLRVRLREHLAAIRHADVRAFYARALKQKMLDFFPLAPYNQPAQAAWRSDADARGNVRGSTQDTVGRAVRLSPLVRGAKAQGLKFWQHEAALAAAMLCHPALLLEQRETLAHCRLQDKELARMRDEMIAYADGLDSAAQESGDAPRPQGEDLQAHLRDNLHNKGFAPLLARLARHPMQGKIPCLIPSLGAHSAPAAAQENWLEIVREHHHLSELEAERQAAEAEFEQTPDDPKAQARLAAIKAALAKLERRDTWIKPAAQPNESMTAS